MEANKAFCEWHRRGVWHCHILSHACWQPYKISSKFAAAFCPVYMACRYDHFLALLPISQSSIPDSSTPRKTFETEPEQFSVTDEYWSSVFQVFSSEIVRKWEVLWWSPSTTMTLQIVSSAARVMQNRLHARHRYRRLYQVQVACRF